MGIADGRVQEITDWPVFLLFQMSLLGVVGEVSHILFTLSETSLAIFPSIASQARCLLSKYERSIYWSEYIIPHK